MTRKQQGCHCEGHNGPAFFSKYGGPNGHYHHKGYDGEGGPHGEKSKAGVCCVCRGPVNQSSASDWMAWVTKLDAEPCALYVRIYIHSICVSVCVYVGVSVHVETRGKHKMSSSVAVHFIIIFKFLIINVCACTRTHVL